MTLDHGAPISLYQASREMGHGFEEMVRRGYAHLASVRHRSKVVEFRIEQHENALKDRLGALGFVTRNATREQGLVDAEAPASMDLQAGEEFRSGPGATRTRDLLLRRQALYPTELRTR